MAKGMFDVVCPCCQAILTVDPETRAVIAHTVPVSSVATEMSPAAASATVLQESPDGTWPLKSPS